MPFTRPLLSDLRNQVAQDIAASLKGSDPLLRFSNLKITGVAQANLANLHYGYLDWIAKQSNPFTATDEYLEAWAALKKVYRKAASQAVLTVTFPGTAGTIPAGAGVVRGDGVTYTTQAAATIVGTTVTVNVIADADPTGQSGAFGNTAVGSKMTLSQAIAGIQSSGTAGAAIAVGADLEKDDSLRSRMLTAYQNTPQGGDEADYVEWAGEVPGVTRAWCVRNGYGAGTVVVYFMLDVSEAANNGFPQGTNGVAASEPRAASATGEQLVVANYLYPVQPVTALVYVCAPIPAPVNFTISGIPIANRGSVQSAIADVFFRKGSAKGGTIPINLIWSAIASVSGVTDFIISVPLPDITNAVGTLPTVGIITYL
ncbi:MAG: baseplate J/gp47 family protein [Collimonas sp.]|uniref:baseplate J/gp47 family protein n=1 Tax=Collimonas sp. TaxID=1963772 RepID=UPI003265D11F